MCDFLFELQTEYEKISINQIGRLEQGLSPDGVVSRCRTVVNDMHTLRANIDRLLNGHLHPMLASIKDISDEEEAVLFTTVQKISSYETRLDPGLALTIYQSLLERAREKRDTDRIVKYLYWCGVTLYYLNLKEKDKILAYFKEGSSYAQEYDNIKTAETRRYIHRCLGNHVMSLYGMKESEKALKLQNKTFSFWNGIIFSGRDADFPWLNLFIACYGYQYGAIAWRINNEPDSETKENLQKILEVSITMYKLYEKNRGPFNQFGGVRYDFQLWSAQFHSGLISFDQFVENVDKKQAEVAPDDYSSDALYVRVQLYAFLMHDAAKMKRLSGIKDRFITETSKKVADYISTIPSSVNPRDVNMRLRLFAEYLSGVMDPKEHLDFVLKMTTFRHLPTYAHSIMVGKLAACLTGFAIEKSPESFIGCLDLETAGDVALNAERLRDFAYTGGLCHDIGTLSYANNPFMLARLLTEDELNIIRLHPRDGYTILTRDRNTASHSGYLDVIMGHHKHYDNVGGYPEDFDINESKHKMMIYIIKAADMIDSATDDVGKPYSGSKSLEEACSKIKDLAGSEYSPVVAEILGDPAVAEELARILRDERREAYYTAYSHAWS
jgi:hypothetical protein